MSKNFLRGCDNLDTAEYKLDKSAGIKDKEIKLNSACFHLCCAIDYLLKAVLELAGQTYTSSSYIKMNLDKLPEEQKEDLSDIINILYSKSGLYCDWYINSRCKDDFEVSMEDIQETLEICYCLKSYIEGINFETLVNF